MVRTASTMLELGTLAPDFRLPDTTGRLVAKGDLDAFAAFAREYVPRGLGTAGISSNDVEEYPDDSPEKMVEEARLRGHVFPYLFDGTQAVAKAYRAACTPDFFLFDRERRLVYRGQFDDSRPKTETPLPVTGADLRAAADAVLAGRPVPGAQKPSLGCNIKWKEGNEPSWFGSG